MLTPGAPEPIFEIDDAIQYEWCRLAIYRHPVRPECCSIWSGSGCSCSFWEPPSEHDLLAAEPYFRAQARARVIQFIESHRWCIDAGDAIRYLERFEVAMNEAEQC